jgi:hypothetical protein
MFLIHVQHGHYLALFCGCFIRKLAAYIFHLSHPYFENDIFKNKER